MTAVIVLVEVEVVVVTVVIVVTMVEVDTSTVVLCGPRVTENVEVIVRVVGMVEV
jgi:hypothetical protein